MCISKMLKSWFNRKDEVTSDKITDISTEKLLNLLQNISGSYPKGTEHFERFNITEEEYQFLHQLGLIEYCNHIVRKTEKGELAKHQLSTHRGLSLEELLKRL